MPAARRVFAGASASPGSVHALRQAAGLARHVDAIQIPRPHGCRPTATSTSACTPPAAAPAVGRRRLAQQAGYGLRGWACRRRGLSPDTEQPA
jgi:hypothetical protein